MSDSQTLRSLRHFLLLVVAGLCVMIMIELWFEEHVEDLQLIPFVLCCLTLVTTLLYLRRPRRGTLIALRVSLVLLAAASLLGIWLHLSGNFAFELEIRPNAGIGDVWYEALSGASPLLAPGILALAATLAAAATWRQDPSAATDGA
ncbi:MAG: hypothetical protein OXH77_01095 [Anaerolineaceae bacterium]|nr:hypothetical protein [Anaerolineaceae bacterium]